MDLSKVPPVSEFFKEFCKRDCLPKLMPNHSWNDALTLKIQKADLAPVLKCGLLLMNDALVESHEVSQSIPDATGSYWHGIMHRREPDYPNAKYWFNKVGRHPIFPEVRNKALELLPCYSGKSKRLRNFQELLREMKDWSPFLHVDLAEERARSRNSAFVDFLKKLQWEEMKILLRHSVEAQA
jgi:hypothetical protein